MADVLTAIIGHFLTSVLISSALVLRCILLPMYMIGFLAIRSLSRRLSASTAGRVLVRKWAYFVTFTPRRELRLITVQAQRCVNCTSWQDGREELH